jgi:hypothetical protein
LQEWAQIQHFMPHPWQSKELWKAGLRIWVTNLALRASSGNQEMVIERENIMIANSALRASTRQSNGNIKVGL